MEQQTEQETIQNEQTQPQERAYRRTAVVVGGSSGIGRETALKLASKGYRVFNISRTPFKGERVQTITADAAQEGELQRAIDKIGEEFGSIELLIYSAGFSMAPPLEKAKSGDYRYLIEVNYFCEI